MKESILRIVRVYSSENKEISADTEFYELHIDSLAFVSMIAEIEDALSINLDDEELDFTLYETINDLITVFERKVKNEKNISNETNKNTSL